MDDGTGFDLLEAIDNIDFKIIFITAYEQYAIKAFKFSAVDYILKPVNPEELAEAVQRAGEVQQEEYNTRLEALAENIKEEGHQQKKIILKTLENIYLMDVKDITYCESDGCYTKMNTADGEMIIVSKTLKEYDELLKDQGFYRIHKSYLINLKYIKRFEKQDGGYVVLSGDEKIPVASRKKEELLELFEKLAD
jgi:two-component system LytT family response regulator